MSLSGTSYNIVGGNTPEERNIISGNNGAGIAISGAISNTVSGNFLGTDVSGTGAIPNSGDGVQMWGGSTDNQIGGNNGSPGVACTGECNLISGNGGGGVSLNNTGTENNRISGNYIGTDLTGTSVISNQNTGVYFFDSANSNTIGGDTPAERNLISGNGQGGISINTNQNKIVGNYIGVNASGSAALGNVGTGVGIWGDAEFNMVGGSTPGEGNLISGHTHSGVNISGPANNNTVIGNLIGTNATGTEALPNGFSGVGLQLGAHHNTIGGFTNAERNIISGNAWDGVWIQDSGTSHNTIIGNYIGVDISGSGPLGNSGEGIIFGEGASQNTVGISNTIVFNGRFGVIGVGSATIENRITRNSIHHNNFAGIGLADGANHVLPSPSINSFDFDAGTASGWVDIAACGGPCTIEIFSDDEDEGRRFEGATTATTNNWSFNKGSAFDGPNLTTTATDASGNTSGFSLPVGGGCSVTTTADSGTGSLRQCLQSAATGTTITFDPSVFPPANPATIAVINGPLPGIIHNNVTIDASNVGVILDGDGLSTGSGLVIDGASGVRIKGLQILNFPVHGVYLKNGASNNTIGGNNPTPDSRCTGDCNLLSKNGDTGVYMFGTDVTNNVVSGNFIGTDLSGTLDWGNFETGVGVDEGTYNFIGGSTPEQRNLISGNDGNGVGVKSVGGSHNTVNGNYIGTDVNGDPNLGNSWDGVVIRVGTVHNRVERNLVGGNGNHGVHVDEPATLYNTISQNSIFSNSGTGIKLSNGGNTELPAPILTACSANSVKGIAPSGSQVEIFSDNENEGRYYHDVSTANGSGDFSLIVAGGFTGTNVTVTATDSEGNTSEFSAPCTPTENIIMAILQPKPHGSVDQSIVPIVEVENLSTIPANVQLSVSASGSALNSAYGPHNVTQSLPPKGQADFNFPSFTPNSTGSYNFVATLDADVSPYNLQKSVDVSVTGSNVDLWLRDTLDDTGDVPSFNRFWRSPDIWVRHNDDNGTKHQNPIAGRTNWVYMIVRNRGDAPSDGNDTAKIYWHNPSLAIQCNKWAYIDTQPIAVTQPDGTQWLKFPWTPTRTGHNCLYGEIISDDDPVQKACRVKWDNNLAQRNVNILLRGSELESQASGGVDFEITNIRDIAKPVDIIVDVSDVPDANAVELDLGAELIARWVAVNGEAKSSGIEWNGGNTIAVTNAYSGTIVGIPMEAGETKTVSLLVNAPSVTTTTVTIYEAIDAGTGVAAVDAIIGGNTYIISGEDIKKIYLPIIVKDN